MLRVYEYDVQLKPAPFAHAGTIYTCNQSMVQDLGSALYAGTS